jgi:hypothetical protein
VPCVFPPAAQLPLTWLLLEGAQFTQVCNPLMFIKPTLSIKTSLSMVQISQPHLTPPTIPPYHKPLPYPQNHLAGLPKGLLYLHIDVAWGCEGGFNGMGFKFATFDCTSLPSTLTTLVFNADRAPPHHPALIYTNDERPRGPIEQVGTLPPHLQQLMLAPEQHVDVQPSLLPRGCSLRRSQDINSDEFGFLSSDSTH